MPMRGALSAPTTGIAWRLQVPGFRWGNVSGLIWTREAIAVALFCAVGLLLSIWLLPSFLQSDDVATYLVPVL
jgi:hypothetical protein